MSSDTEVARVLSNPDHVIISDSLQSLLGDESSSYNTPEILTKIKCGDFSADGELKSLKFEKECCFITLLIPAFFALESMFKLKDEIKVSFNETNDISGKLISSELEKNEAESSSNFNLTLCIEQNSYK